MKRWWAGLFTERPDELLPREWIALALLASVAAIVGGGILVGKDFWVNILASLALLGPGLLLTNVIAGSWRARRQVEQRNKELLPAARHLYNQLWRQIIAPTVQLIFAVAGDSVDIPLLDAAPDDAKKTMSHLSVNLIMVEIGLGKAADLVENPLPEDAVIISMNYGMAIHSLEDVVVALERHLEVGQARRDLQGLEGKLTKLANPLLDSRLSRATDRSIKEYLSAARAFVQGVSSIVVDLNSEIAGLPAILEDETPTPTQQRAWE